MVAMKKDSNKKGSDEERYAEVMLARFSAWEVKKRRLFYKKKVMNRSTEER